jgi:hypothetical protein
MNRDKNEDTRRRDGSDASIEERINRNVLRWYGMWRGWKRGEWLKYIYSAKVEGSEARGTPNIRCMDSVKASVERNEIYRRCEKVQTRTWPVEEDGVFLICEFFDYCLGGSCFVELLAVTTWNSGMGRVLCDR